MEITTEQVMSWISYLGGSFTRINGKDLLNDEMISIFDDENVGYGLKINNKNIDFNSINIVWYRRWAERTTVSKVKFESDELFEIDINSHRSDEFKGLSEYFFSLIKNKTIIGSPHNLVKNPSKLTQLQIAKEVGIYTPSTLVTNNKSELVNFFNLNNKKVIVKAINEAGLFTIGDIPFVGYTGLITDEVLSLLPDIFFPSLFQEYLDKEVEIRTFYLNKECYSMAIFSSLDAQTEVDFRKYNNKKPNRNVPFSLPQNLTDKVIMLMEKLNLNTGSLDFILTKNGKFIFLEVNHGGQFGMVSMPCNYHLERRVAEILIENDK